MFLHHVDEDGCIYIYDYLCKTCRYTKHIYIYIYIIVFITIKLVIVFWIVITIIFIIIMIVVSILNMTIYYFISC